MSRATRATMALERAGVAFTVHAYDYDPNADKVGIQAAEALGEAPERVLKTLMALVDGKPVCVIVPSNREVSMKKLASAFGGKSAQMMKPPTPNGRPATRSAASVRSARCGPRERPSKRRRWRTPSCSLTAASAACRCGSTARRGGAAWRDCRAGRRLRLRTRQFTTVRSPSALRRRYDNAGMQPPRPHPPSPRETSQGHRETGNDSATERLRRRPRADEGLARIRTQRRRSSASRKSSWSLSRSALRRSTPAPSASTCTPRRRARSARPNSASISSTPGATRPFSSRERAALAWTEALTRLADKGAPDDVYAALKAEFSEGEQVALTLLIVTINGWNRIQVGFRVPIRSATLRRRNAGPERPSEGEGGLRRRG